MIRVQRRRRVQTQRRLDLTARPGVKLYRALLTQSGSSAPTATVLENSLGAVIAWTRSSAGSYVGTLTGAFVSAKSVVLCGSASDTAAWANAKRVDANTVRVATGAFDGTPTDDVLNQTAVEILIYP